MKKIISVILAVLMICTTGAVSVFATDEALPLSAGIETLQAAFEKGKGPETDTYAIDYRYFSPVKADDTTKYPLVVWLHGMGDGSEEGKQVEKSNIAFWASDEYQARFRDTEGAFILAARSPEEKLVFWDDTTIYPLRAAIDAFIAENEANIDLTRIYIGGYSMGGKMTLKMAVAYPDMFAAIFPICPAWAPSAEQTALIADIPVWLTSGKTDPLINYQTSIIPTWEKIVENSNVASDCRLSTLNKVKYADGTNTSSGHHAWFAVNNDMFSAENGDYPEMSTVNGLGETVTLTYPEGMISWLSQFSSDFDGTPAEDTGNIPVTEETHNLFSIDTIVEFFKTVMDFFRKIMDMMFGFMK